MKVVFMKRSGKYSMCIRIMEAWLSLITVLSLLGAFTACGSSNKSDVSAAGSAMKFGVAPQWYQNFNPPSESPSNVDVVVVGDWLIQEGFTEAHRKKISQIVARGKTPYIFGYIATAKIKQGLGEQRDCDGDSSAQLCQNGASYLRSHIDRDIVPAYRNAAQQISLALRGREALIHIEPDWYQFSQKAQKNALSRQESNNAMNKILRAIKEGCNRCKVVIDFSPWFSPDKTQWATSARDFYEGWDRSVVKYVGLTGKKFPFTTGKIDNFSYQQITTELSLPLVIVNAYTFGGGPIDIDFSWLSRDSIDKASQMGIAMVFMSQQGNVQGYNSFIGAVRAQGGVKKPVTPSAAPKKTPPKVGAPPIAKSSSQSDLVATGGRIEVKSEITSQWDKGFCKKVMLKNVDTKAVEWTVRSAKKGPLLQHWSSNLSEIDNKWVFTGLDYNKNLLPGQSTEIGFCAPAY